LDILSHARDRVLQEIADFLVGILNKGLLDQTDFRIESIELSFYDLVHDLFGGHVLPPDVTWTRGGNLHRDVFEQRLEFRRARDEIRLAVQLDHDTDLAASVDVRADETLGRYTA